MHAPVNWKKQTKTKASFGHFVGRSARKMDWAYSYSSGQHWAQDQREWEWGSKMAHHLYTESLTAVRQMTQKQVNQYTTAIHPSTVNHANRTGRLHSNIPHYYMLTLSRQWPVTIIRLTHSLRLQPNTSMSFWPHAYYKQNARDWRTMAG